MVNKLPVTIGVTKDLHLVRSRWSNYERVAEVHI